MKGLLLASTLTVASACAGTTPEFFSTLHAVERGRRQALCTEKRQICSQSFAQCEELRITIRDGLRLFSEIFWHAFSAEKADLNIVNTEIAFFEVLILDCQKEGLRVPGFITDALTLALDTKAEIMQRLRVIENDLININVRLDNQDICQPVGQCRAEVLESICR